MLSTLNNLLAIIKVESIIDEIIKYVKFISKEYTIAIKDIDIKSSTTAKDNKNTLSAGLNLLENKMNIPTVNAISVDIGMQKPLKNGLFLFIAINIKAGTITPPIDAKTGKEAFLKEDRLPYSISYFISKPATKKNIDIRNSFINICIENPFTI